MYLILIPLFYVCGRTNDHKHLFQIYLSLTIILARYDWCFVPYTSYYGINDLANLIGCCVNQLINAYASLQPPHLYYTIQNLPPLRALPACLTNLIERKKLLLPALRRSDPSLSLSTSQDIRDLTRFRDVDVPRPPGYASSLLLASLVLARMLGAAHACFSDEAPDRGHDDRLVGAVVEALPVRVRVELASAAVQLVLLSLSLRSLKCVLERVNISYIEGGGAGQGWQEEQDLASFVLLAYVIGAVSVPGDMVKVKAGFYLVGGVIGGAVLEGLGRGWRSEIWEVWDNAGRAGVGGDGELPI